MSLILFGPPVHFDFGARKLLPQVIASARCTKPLFVTDRGVLAAGVFTQATEALPAGLTQALFSEVPPNPTEASAIAGAQAFHDFGCDGVVGIGGGAALDLAKAIAILATHSPPLWNYSNRNPNELPLGVTPPLILLPTTAGTGSEVGRSAVIIFDNGIKAGVRCPAIVTAAICDPELTLGLPPLVTATTGMDALAHCIETYCSATVNPPADAIAVDGMERIFSHIHQAVKHGKDRQARWNMMMGSLEGALCFQKGMGAVHACAHPLGALGYHHGTLNAILLPHVLRLNLELLGKKADKIAELCGAKTVSQIPDIVSRLVTELGIPLRLSDLGLDRIKLNSIAQAAMLDNANKTNPRLMSVDLYETLLNQAY
jgi:alcohol dehydrogenase class IV